MTAVASNSPQRYRRRVIGLGALVLVLTFAIGAAIFVPVVQNDLTDRVQDELIETGVAGVTASFSGQDGTLRCADPLDDPDATEQLAQDVRGVRAIDLDRSCTAGASSQPPTEQPTDVATTETEATDPPPTEATGSATTTSTTEAPPATEPELDRIGAIVDGDPLFSELASALGEAVLLDEDALGGDGPFTLLAPTDAAFDAAFEELGADAFDALTSDPEMLRTVLLHHATEGAIGSADFAAGDLEMLDGTTIMVDPGADGGITFTSDGVTSSVADPDTQLDIEASNGVVHAIDRLLIPDGLDLGGTPGGNTGGTAGDATEPDDVATTAAAGLADGRITLSGVVESEAQRVELVTAAQVEIDAANVVDELIVDPASAVADADVTRLGTVISAMAPNLVAGEATLLGADLSLSGTYVDDAASTALEQLADDPGVTLDVRAREAADDETAQTLEDELNDFVRADPILFESNSATLTADANAVIEQVAARAGSLDGTAITIVGHTDSDGAADSNQALSSVRAGVVLEALVAQGVGVATLTSEGRGSSEPVLDAAGAEDKAASRRVEFIVEAT